MAANRLEIMDIRQLLQLKTQGFSNRKIGKIIGVHRNSINEYVRLFNASKESYEALLKHTDEELLVLFPIKGSIDKLRYEELSGYFPYFLKELFKPGCTRQTLWREYLYKHPEGYSYTQFNHHFNQYLNRVKASGKLIHKAGEQLYIDYTGKKLHYTDPSTGEVISVEVFVGVLPCSGYTFVQASPSQKREDFIDCLNNCLSFLGGVPRVIVPDNLKAAVSKASKYEPVLNKTFKAFALHYGCAINPTRAYSPKDKALVEGAVKLVYQRIFYPLSKMDFFSLREINEQVHKQLQVYNDYLLSHIQVSRRQQFQTLESDFLQALPNQAYQLRYYKVAKVQKMGYIFLSSSKNYYSVPYRYIGKKVQVQYNQNTVEVYYQTERLASHLRSFKAGHYVTIPEHLSSQHQFYNDWNPDYFKKLAAPLGESVQDYVTALIDQAAYPEIGYKQCLGIIALAKTYSKQRLNNACKRGLGFHRYGYRTIKNILENKMDLLEQTQRHPRSVPDHENIRGAEYYQ